MLENLTIGTDPEGWLYHKQKKEFIPIIGLLGGTKEEPLALTELGHAVQEDNCSWEFNIPPVRTLSEFNEACNLCLEHIQAIVGPEYALVIKPSVAFDPKYLGSKKAVEIGCSADQDAYEYEVLEAPVLNSNVRYAGGHIHIGWKGANWLDCIQLIYWLDLYLGTVFTLIDSDENRKAIYGTAGRHRTKDYGLEYRVLSNIWLSDPMLMEMMWNQLHKGIESFVNRKDMLERAGIHKQVRAAINTNNESDLLNLITSYGVISEVTLNECRDRIKAGEKQTILL